MKLTVKNILTKKIKHNPFEVRDHIDTKSDNFNDLIKSIKNMGMINPILVRPYNGNYQIIAGSRRLAASKKAKISYIPATIRNLTDLQSRIISLTENSHRENLTDFEKANALKKIYEGAGYTLDTAVRNVKSYEHAKERNIYSDVPEEFTEICDEISQGLNSQYIFLRLAKDLTPTVLKRVDLSTEKKIILTRPTVKSDPHLQKTVAHMIKDMPIKSARDLVHNIERGNYKFTGKSFKVGSDNETVNLKPKEFTEEARLLFVRNTNRLSDIAYDLTNKDRRSYNDELIENTSDFRLDTIKRLKVPDLNNWYNSIVPVVNLLNDMLEKLDKELTTREKNKQLYSK